ncbi:MAG: hypothetical protein M1829_002795 [Trizodia sp. TS-e1964]|nr:MAG: hypothetical protein M1829_002795 [Trizodia sp. TS-e1964]
MAAETPNPRTRTIPREFLEAQLVAPVATIVAEVSLAIYQNGDVVPAPCTNCTIETYSTNFFNQCIISANLANAPPDYTNPPATPPHAPKRAKQTNPTNLESLQDMHKIALLMIPTIENQLEQKTQELKAMQAMRAEMSLLKKQLTIYRRLVNNFTHAISKTEQGFVDNFSTKVRKAEVVEELAAEEYEEEEEGEEGKEGEVEEQEVHTVDHN